MERLTTLVASSDSPDELCKAIFAAVDAFAAGVPQYDDQTLLIVRSKT
jgi:serine phosphatase RsbU (regulator of sigma subunit)